MIGERSMFIDLKPHEGGAFSFIGIGKEKISGIVKIGIPSLTLTSALSQSLLNGKNE